MPREVIKAISVKSLFGNVSVSMFKDLPDDAKIPLLRFFGIVREMETKESTKGVYTAAIGDFTGIPLSGENEGVVTEATKAFPPKLVSDELERLLKAKPGTSVEFAYDIGVKRDTKSATGYVYTVTSLKTPAENAAMQALKQEFGKIDPADKKVKSAAAAKDKGK
jgi:hypothetical protein